MNKIVELTDSNFDKIVKESEEPVLVEFFASWCGHCKNQAPILDELVEHSDGNYIVGQINIDDNQRKALEYSITGVPAFLVFKDGEIVDHKSGTHRLQDLKNLIEQYV